MTSKIYLQVLNISQLLRGMLRWGHELLLPFSLDGLRDIWQSRLIPVACEIWLYSGTQLEAIT